MRRRLPLSLGGWLVLLALCALSLQGLQHYQPQMLSAFCSVGSGEASSAPDGKVGKHGTDCGSCCARVNAATLPRAEGPPLLVAASIDSAVLPTLRPRASSRAWSPSRPRGPPGLA